MLRSTRARPALDSEDPAHDHVESDRLHPRREGKRPADGPAVDLTLGGIGDHLLVAGDRLAVERGQEQLALTQVPRAVGGQNRSRPEHRTKRRLGGDRWHQLG